MSCSPKDMSHFYTQLFPFKVIKNYYYNIIIILFLIVYYEKVKKTSYFEKVGFNRKILKNM